MKLTTIRWRITWCRKFRKVQVEWVKIDHYNLDCYMCKEEVSEAPLGRDRRELGLVGRIYLQLRSYSLS